jgi:hypothetical protein
VDIGTFGVRQDGDFSDVDPLAAGLNDTAPSLGDGIPEGMVDNHTDGVQEKRTVCRKSIEHIMKLRKCCGAFSSWTMVREPRRR